MTEQSTTYREDIEQRALDAMGTSYVEEFIGAYIECALWSESAGIEVADDGSVTEAPDDDTSFLSHNFDESDLTREARENISADCHAFIADNAADLRAVAMRHTENGWSAASQSGHDFWLTRNGHGAGFWDRGYGVVGDRLTRACEPYGETHLYISDGDMSDVFTLTIGIE